jgi:hypothetical protein
MTSDQPSRTAYDDTVARGRTLPETVAPSTWPDHGFCALACGGGDHGVRRARHRAGGGAGAWETGRPAEEELIRQWRRELQATPDGMLGLQSGTVLTTRSAGMPTAGPGVYLTTTHAPSSRSASPFD